MAIFATLNEEGRIVSIKQCPPDTIIQDNEYDISFYTENPSESLLFAKYDIESQNFEFDDDYEIYNSIVNDTLKRDASWIESELNVILNEESQKYGYDNIISVTSYANSTNQKFADEGKAFVEWRDNVWNWYFDHLKKIEEENIYPVERDRIREEIPQFINPNKEISVTLLDPLTELKVDTSEYDLLVANEKSNSDETTITEETQTDIKEE